MSAESPLAVPGETVPTAVPVLLALVGEGLIDKLPQGVETSSAVTPLSPFASESSDSSLSVR